jgi:hypothetical protein
MKKIKAGKVLYIKLGKKGEFEGKCIGNGTLHIGFREVSHELSVMGQWEKVKEEWLAQGRTESVATNYTNQMRHFYEADKSVLWVTFYQDALWWCFVDSPVTQESDNSKMRRAKSCWSDKDINGQRLLKSRLSGKLLSMQGFQSTICTVKEADYLIAKINGEEPKEIVKARASLTALEESLIVVIQRLGPKDFEILIDLIVSRAGWQRITDVGGTQKDTDLDVVIPITNESCAIQVKAAAGKREFEEYKARFANSQSYTRGYFVVHTPKVDLKKLQGEIRADDFLQLWLPHDVARLTLQYGLAQWVIDKAM